MNLGSDKGRSTGVTTNMRPSFKFRLRWVVWLQRKTSLLEGLHDPGGMITTKMLLSFKFCITGRYRYEYNKYAPKLQLTLNVDGLVTTKILLSFNQVLHNRWYDYNKYALKLEVTFKVRGLYTTNMHQSFKFA